MDGYDAVVIGGALYMNRWHTDACRFVERFGDQLRGTPVWLFSSGPLDEQAAHQDLAPTLHVLDVTRGLTVRGHHTFGGKLLPTDDGLLERFMLRGGLIGDFREPERVLAYARQIAASLAPAQVAVAAA